MCLTTLCGQQEFKHLGNRYAYKIFHEKEGKIYPQCQGKDEPYEIGKEYDYRDRTLQMPGSLFVEDSTQIKYPEGFHSYDSIDGARLAQNSIPYYGIYYVCISDIVAYGFQSVDRNYRIYCMAYVSRKMTIIEKIVQ